MARGASIKHNVKYIISAKDLASSAFGKLTKALPSLKTIAVSAGVGVAGIGIAALKATRHFADFETEIINLGQVTSVPLEQLKQRILALPPELGSAAELTKGLYDTISAGVTEPNKAFELLTAAAKAAKGGHVELDTTVRAITKVMAGYGGEIKTAGEASDLMFGIVRSGQVQFAELADQMGGLAALSKTLNVGTDELGGAFSTLSLTAGNAAEASTQYRAVMSSLIKPSEAMQKLIKDLGFEEASEAIGKLGFTGLLEKMQKETKGSAQELGKLFTNKRALVGVVALLNKGMAPLEKNIRDVGKSAGLAGESFDRVAGTLNALWETFKNTIGNIAIKIIDEVAPDIKKGMESITGYFNDNKEAIVQYAKDFIGKIKEVQEKADINFVAIGTTILDFSLAAVTNLTKVVTVMGEIWTALTLQGDAKKGLSETEKAFKILGEAGADFFEGFLLAQKKTNPTDIMTKIGEVVGQTGEFLGKLASDFKDFAIVVGRTVVQVFAEAIEQVRVLLSGLSETLDGAFGLEIDATLHKVSATLAGFVNEIGGAAPKIKEGSKKAFGAIAEEAKKVTPALEAVNGALILTREVLKEKYDIDISTETGRLHILKLRSELDDKIWKPRLVKKIEFNTATAKAKIIEVKEFTDRIPAVTKKELRVNTDKSQIALNEVIKDFVEVDEETEKERIIIIDVDPAVESIDMLLEKLKELNQASSFEKGGQVQEAVEGVSQGGQTQGGSVPTTLSGGATNGGNAGGQPNFNMQSNITVVAGDRNPAQLATDIDAEVAENVRQGRSRIPDALREARAY